MYGVRVCDLFLLLLYVYYKVSTVLAMNVGVNLQKITSTRQFDNALSWVRRLFVFFGLWLRHSFLDFA